MNTETVVLGDRSFTLTEQPLRQNRIYRQKLRENFKVIVELLEKAPKMSFKDSTTVIDMIKAVAFNLIDSVDMMADLLYMFSEEIAKEKEYIEDNATSSQLIDAFVATVLVSFPFMQSQRIQGLARLIESAGLNDKQTAKN